jgi:glycine/D-amino acid oxidase-like deaminating enzyme
MDEGLYWDCDVRSSGCLRLDRQEGQTLALVGLRESFSSEISDARATFRLLTDRLVARVPGVEALHRWAGYVVDTADGLPCVGEVAPGRFVATALGENSLTFGTLAGMLVADLAAGRTNVCQALFAPHRFLPASSRHAALRETTAGSGRPPRSRPSFATLTHQDVAFAHTDEALPSPGVY